MESTAPSAVAPAPKDEGAGFGGECPDVEVPSPCFSYFVVTYILILTEL
jgi:hypothetical protein